MPQANITYDTPYNKALAARILAQEKAKVRKEEPEYFPYRLESFHNPKSKGWVGGGTPRDFIINGNSSYYPPIHMRSGMEVSSGGKYAGVDGAVGGSFWKDFAKGFTSVLDVATAPLAFVAPEVAAPVAALSQGVHALSGQGISGGAMSGAGKGGRAKRADIVKKIMKERGVKMIEASKIVKKEGLYKGGVMVGNKKDACGRSSGTRYYGTPCATGGEASGAGKKKRAKKAKKEGYEAVKDAVEVAKVMEGAGISGGEASGAGKKKAKRAVGAADGRAKRAEIVKKVMKERGVKMIEASKIVKREGLYK